MLVRFQLGQLRLRGKGSGQVLPSHRPSQDGASDPRLPALGHLSCPAFEKASQDDQEDALPACPPAPGSFPLVLTLRPPQFPEPVATSAIRTAGRAQPETDGWASVWMAKSNKQNPLGISALTLAGAARSAQDPVLKQGESKGSEAS